MAVVEGIIGPGVGANDINMELPTCIHIDNPVDGKAFKDFMDSVVRATASNAASVLRAMLAQTPGAEQLASEFAARLGVT